MKRLSLSILTLALFKWGPAFSALEPCAEPDVSALPFCNTNLPAIERARDIVSRLNTTEKINQLMMNASSIEKLHIDAYNWWSESLHGILSDCTADQRCLTSYPMPVGIGATFNMKLIKQMASQISSEARRLFVERAGGTKVAGLDFWAPNVNIFRDPRWGRGMETPGEDPYLSAQYAIHYIKGMQEGEDPRYTKTVATLKHFAAYSLEKWHEYNRIGFDAIISDEDLVQTYLPAFEAGIREGRAESVMCSYNSVNGVPSCANAFLLQDILRDQWDWKGYVVSDCGAIGFVYRPHRYKLSPEEAVAASLLAGTDLNCGNYYQHLPEAIQKGLIADSNLDRALERLFTARIKLGLFDAWKQQPYMQYPPETIGHPEHVETALQIARESLVLLKNDDGALPLSTDTNLTVAILGPHFSSTGALCGNYHGALPPIVSPLQAIKTAFASGDVAGLKGCEIHSNNTAGFDAAIKIAGEADLAILFMGIDTSIEQEGKDRETIDLPGVQAEFIEAIAKVQSKTILVLINGGPIDVSEAKTNPDIVAILEAFYPGMKGSEAIADVLFGKYNPSGRLPYTMHKKDFVDQISMADMSMTNYPGRSYRYFRGEVVYPFGYGLSYTTFEYEVQELGARFGMSGHSDVRCRVRVTNTGSVSGDTSVLAFLSFNNSTNNRHYACPQLQLVGFKKVCLLPGESKDIFFATTTAALKCYRSSDKTLSSPHGSYSVRIDNKEHRFLHGNTSVQSVH